MVVVMVESGIMVVGALRNPWKGAMMIAMRPLVGGGVMYHSLAGREPRGENVKRRIEERGNA